MNKRLLTWTHSPALQSSLLFSREIQREIYQISVSLPMKLESYNKGNHMGRKSPMRFYSRTVGSRSRGSLSGKPDGLRQHELPVIGELLERGYNVRRIPKSKIEKDRAPDLKVNDTITEVKTLNKPNANTGSKDVQKAVKQKAQNVILDARKADITKKQADEIVNRARGSFSDKKLPINVEILTNEGYFYYRKDV